MPGRAWAGLISMDSAIATPAWQAWLQLHGKFCARLSGFTVSFEAASLNWFPMAGSHPLL